MKKSYENLSPVVHLVQCCVGCFDLSVSLWLRPIVWVNSTRLWPGSKDNQVAEAGSLQWERGLTSEPGLWSGERKLLAILHGGQHCTHQQLKSNICFTMTDPRKCCARQKGTCSWVKMPDK